MAISTKVLKTRIASIKNTKKMTKAMELVAASKMRKAVNCVLQSRHYSDVAWNILTRLKEKTDPTAHKLLARGNKVNNVLIVLITSNRGLCGGYNSQIISKTLSSINLHKDIAKTDLIIIGKKGRDMSYRFKQNVIAEFIKEDVITQINEIYPISRLIIDEFLKGTYDSVLLAYNDFVSALVQKPRVRQILPIDKKDEYIGAVTREPTSEYLDDTSEIGVQVKSIEREIESEYLFEPDVNSVLEKLLPRLIETQIYQAYLEANASEHSARMLAMKNASESAGDMIADLELTFNQSRQAAITQEIAEISAGKAVIE